MRVLLTNDDGIEAPALPRLARCLADAGHEVTVAAPLQPHSGCGASIGNVSVEHRVHVRRVTLAGAEAVPAFAVDAPPAFIVLAAAQGLFAERPDVVVSGPNAGLNLGPLVLHSGTLGAAITAASNGIPGIALSTEKRPRFGYETAASFCATHLASLLRMMGEAAALNINVPDLPSDRIAGIRQTRLAPRSLVSIELRDDEDWPRQPEAFRMRIDLAHDHDRSGHRRWRADSGAHDNSDAGAIVDDCISVTLLHSGLRAIDDRDLAAAWQTPR